MYPPYSAHYIFTLQIRVAVSFPLFLISHLAEAALVLSRLGAHASVPWLLGEIGG